MKRIYQALNGPEAHLVRAALEAQGVQAVVQGEMLRMGVGEVPFTEAFPTVWVNDEDTDAAAAIVADYQARRGHPTGGQPWTCPTCGEAIEPQFDECWVCAGHATAELILYGHSDCSLCDRLEAILHPILDHADAPLTLTKRDITTNRDWLRTYRERIPVLTDAEGTVLVEGKPEPDDVAAALAPLLGHD
jgi:hypothetical protein